MQTIFPPLKKKPVFALDFSLTYVGIIFLSISIASTELLKIYPNNKSEIIQVRVLHTFFIFAIVFVTKLFLKARKINTSSYFGLVVIGFWLAIPTLFIRVLLMERFNLISDYQISRYFLQQFLISLGHAFFWIPIVIILGGKRNQIIDAFKEYETRLVVDARRNIRNSDNFNHLKRDINRLFQKELKMHTSQLLNSLTMSDDRKLSLKERNEIVQRFLKGNTLRDFSQKLNQKSESKSKNSKFDQNLNSLNLIRKQFNILYDFTARNSPLSPWVYTLLTFALVLPNYISFLSAKEMFISLPGFLVVQLIAIQIKKILHQGGRYAIFQTNLLTLLIGYIPFFEMILFEIFLPDLSEKFPLVIITLFYPFGFYFYMRFVQILQPVAIKAIRSDEIQASAALKNSIKKIVQEDYKQSISHQWSTYIHGKILTRLAAASLKLEQSVTKNDLESFEIGLNNVKNILENPTQEFEQGYLSLGEEIASRLDPWQGLIQIEIFIDPKLENHSNERVRDLGEVIEEIISNSVRHGKSQNININITSQFHPDIQIVVEDDAINPLPSVPARIGLGTKILNLVSDGRWTISHIEGKTTVKLIMSLLEGK